MLAHSILPTYVFFFPVAHVPFVLSPSLCASDGDFQINNFVAAFQLSSSLLLFFDEELFKDGLDSSESLKKWNSAVFHNLTKSRYQFLGFVVSLSEVVFADFAELDGNVTLVFFCKNFAIGTFEP